MKSRTSIITFERIESILDLYKTSIAAMIIEIIKPIMRIKKIPATLSKCKAF